MTDIPGSAAFCIYPWISQHISAEGQVSLCCKSQGDLDGRNLGHVSELDRSWNSDTMKSIRSSMVDGKSPKQCLECVRDEMWGKKSMRMSANETWINRRGVKDRVLKSLTNEFVVEDTPVYLDVTFGNVCNLICKMCSPKHSDQWEKDLAQLKQDDPAGFDKLFGDDPIYNIDSVQPWDTDPRIMELLDRYIPYLERIYVGGGEPTMTVANLRFLQRCIDLGYASKIDLTMNSNITNVNRKFVDMIVQFKSTRITCSIDGVGLIQDYIRYPSRWEGIRKHLITLFELSKTHSVVVKINCLVQATNVLQLPIIYDELIRLYRHHGNVSGGFGFANGILLNPHTISVANLPSCVKSIAKERLRFWMDHQDDTVRALFKDGTWNNFDAILSMCDVIVDDRTSAASILEYLGFLDGKKRTRLATHCPELHGLLTATALS